ncbi:MAG TPA: alpha-mannosidase [Acidimicrobiales bacterium]|nr:alpha-mannosidase [Acidimicrobiales bacterium]
MTESLALRRARVERTLRQVLPRGRRYPTSPVRLSAYHVGGEPIRYDEAVARPFAPMRVGDPWGAAWDTTWLRVDGRVPDDWAGQETVLVVRIGYSGGTGFGAEALVWRDGEPVQAITPNHDEIPVDGPDFTLYIEAAANPPVQRLDPAPMYMPDPGGTPLFRLAACHLAVAHREVEALWEDWSVLLELHDRLPESEPRRAQILRALERAGRVLDPDDLPGTAAAARDVLRPMLDRPAHASAHRYLAVGNAHIDSAWLWPVRETRRKVARTFSTALDLMERYPEYRFTASQAQQLAWIRDDYPGLYDRIRKKVAQGQFEVVGSMWVEADCNIPSGESLVRQIAHGKRFFSDEMDVDTRSLWLPDVFGYPANLPQILALAGVRWFLTQKMSWNQVNRFPHHTFWWQGIDGTRVLSHFPPADTYVGDLSMGQLEYGVGNFAQKELCNTSMYLYGWGDGGGGPTRHMLERARRLSDLESAPRVRPVTSDEAFEAIEADAPLEELPVWAGELYLEIHRGTYTTHAEVKKANRRLELALRDVELWSTAAVALGALPDYPAGELDSSWKTLLLNQFHDIIPGSSIHWVYRDTARDHDRVAETTDRLVEGALGAVAGGVTAPGMARPALVANPLSWPRREVVDVGGRPVWVEAPACGWSVHDLDGAGGPPADVPVVEVGNGWMSNGILRVAWDADGLLTSVLHMATGREALASGARGNVLQVHADRPLEYDAWDIDADAFNAAVDLTTAEVVELSETGPLRAVVRVVRRFRSSTVEQRLVLRAGSPALEVETVIDWQEPRQLLKAAFPVSVHSPRASFEVQFGHLERPTHRNTTWEQARFEVCAHTWADLSETGFGVALLNDCKYGYDVAGNSLRLSLLRTPTWPDPVADIGHHELTYALMPHAGDLAAGGVVGAAHALNSPLRVVPVGSVGSSARDTPAPFSAVTVDDPGAVVTAVKRADRGDGVVVRLYEAFGGARTVRVGCPLVASAGAPRVTEVDLLERPTGADVDCDAGRVVVHLRPFQIVTLLFEEGS